VIESVATSSPFAVLFAALSVTALWYYRKQNLDHIHSLERRFELETKAVTDAHERVLIELNRVISELRKERNDLRKELAEARKGSASKEDET
jgi:hypothetical protein